jgi:hypothetical protein
MKQKLSLAVAVAIALLSCKNEKKNTEDKIPTEKVAGTKMVDSATMMKNWQEYMTPGDMHKMMTSWAGKWEGQITMWEKPGAAPQTAVGMAEYKSILNGLYMESIHTGNMMGMPFEGHETMAYDNAKKMFMTTWVDNMGSGIMEMEGPWDATAKTITLKGKAYEPSTGTEAEYRQVVTIIDDNTQKMEMFGPGPDGKEWKLMEINSVRK